MACAQKNHLPLTEGSALEGEKGLTYWCMPAIVDAHFRNPGRKKNPSNMGREELGNG